VSSSVSRRPSRLSQSFFMRDFLFSEIAAIEGLSNLPDDPELAIAAGRGLCENLLEPLQATFGRIAIRSAYRSPEVNDFGCRHRLSCASNERNRARHTWDRRSKDGRMGALTTIVVPWLVDRMDTTSWQAMAWWIAADRRSVFPEVSKPIRRKLTVSDGMLDVLVAEIVLQRPSIHTLIGQLEPS
jgi:hypothetical protein